MKKQIITILVSVSLLFSACQNSAKTKSTEKHNPVSVATQEKAGILDITFIEAKNYFVKNDINQLENPKIATENKFKEVFGMATTMGKEGTPTKIDFSKQYVIAVLFPKTNLSTTINPISLQKNQEGDITFTYKSKVGKKQTYTTRPYIAIIVDKLEKGKITLKEI